MKVSFVRLWREDYLSRAWAEITPLSLTGKVN